MKRLLCHDCGKNLRNQEIALNLKIRGRSVGVFYCEDCLSERTDSTVAELRELARFFSEHGCALFSRHYVNEE